MSVSWINAASDIAWDNVGGDYTEEDSASTGYTYPSSWEHYNVTGIVQKVTDGTSNYGFIIGSDLASGNTHRDYCSSEYTSGDSLRPKLTVTYTSNAVIPGLQFQGLPNGLQVHRSISGIRIYVPFSEYYRISLYNVNGRRIETISGHQKQWYQLTNNKSYNGIYVTKITTRDKSYTDRLILIE